ncbi:MAG: hypothetical protein ACK40E_05840 [Caldimicrobium sp.]
MLKFDITLLIQIIEALSLAIILNFILIKPIMNFLEERRRIVKGVEDEIADILRQVEEGLRNYQETLNEARREGLHKREALKEEARKIEKEELSKILKEIAEQKKEWERVFKSEFEKLRAELFNQREFFAQLIVEKLLGRKV